MRSSSVGARLCLRVPVITVFFGVEEPVATEASIARFDLADRGAHITLPLAIWAIFGEGVSIVASLARFEESVATRGLDTGRRAIDKAASEP